MCVTRETMLHRPGSRRPGARSARAGVNGHGMKFAELFLAPVYNTGNSLIMQNCFSLHKLASLLCITIIALSCFNCLLVVYCYY